MHFALTGALIVFAVAQIDPAPSIKTGHDSSWTIRLAGDIMLGRGVKRLIDKNGQGYPFAKTCSLTVRADLAVANLESPLTTAQYLTSSPWKFTGDTLDAALALKAAGFSFVSIANNHMADCGRAGLLETARWLDSAGVAHAGVTNADTVFFDSLKTNDSTALSAYAGTLICRPVYLAVKGLKIGFLSFCEPYLLAIAKDHGAELVARADSATVSNSIMAARDSCDLLICSFHWGEEYRDYPTKTQKKLGRIAIDAGARIVHGHHPHVLEGVEFYKQGLIAYSLGNFIFDQRHEKQRQSALLTVKLRRSDCSSGGAGMSTVLIDSVILRPLEIVDNRPQPAGRRGWRAITKRLMLQCKKLGTVVNVQDSLLCLSPKQVDVKKPR